MVSTAVEPSTEAAVRNLSGWRERAFVPTLVGISLVAAMLSSLGAPLLPTIAAANHVSLSSGQWLLTAALLSGAITAPIFGQLGDGRHRRRVVIAALTIVIIGSFTAALFNGFAILIAARALQGVGLALTPVAMVIARHHLPSRRSTTVIGLLSICVATGVGLGYPLTGFIAESFDYHVAFWVGGAIMVVALVMAVIVLPSDPTGPPTHLDVVGAVLFGLPLTALLMAVSEGANWGWGSPAVLGLLAFAVIVGSVCVRYELRTHQPLIVFAHLRMPVVVITNIMAFAMGATLYLLMPIVVEFVQIPKSAGFGFGASVLVAGVCLLPLSVGTAVASPVVRIVRERYGPRVVLIAAPVVAMGAALFFAFVHDSLWEAFVTMGLTGVAFGLSFGTMPGLIVAAVPRHEVGTAMGLYQVIRGIGLTVGSAIGAASLAANTPAHESVPSVDGYRDALLISAFICVVLIPLGFLFPARSRGPVAQTVAAPTEP